MNTYLIEFLNENGAETCIRYSKYTKKYYVSTTAKIVEDGFFIEIVIHEQTIEEAITSFNKKIGGNLLKIDLEKIRVPKV